MIVDRAQKDQPNMRTVCGLKVVESYVYFGFQIINTDVTIVRSAVVKLTKIWKDMSVSNKTKLQSLHTLVYTYTYTLFLNSICPRNINYLQAARRLMHLRCATKDY